MSLFNEIKDAFDFKKRKHQDPLTTQRERRILFIVGAAALFVLALGTLFLTSVAGSSGIGACKGILLAQEKNDCFYSLANSTSNYSICSYIPNRGISYQCISTVALKEQNPLICAKINSSNYEFDLCIYNVSYAKDNASYCSVLGSNSESTCAYNIARKNQFNNKNDCNPIINASQKNLCEYIYYYNAAASLHTSSYCSLLPNVVNSTLLTTLITKDFQNNETGNLNNYLGYSELNVSPISYCYYNVAQVENNRSLCAYTQGLISNSCYEYFTKTTSAPNITNASQICGNAPSYVQGVCTFSVFTSEAIAQDNVSACLRISNSSYQQSCIVQLGEKYANASVCNYIENNQSALQACVVSATSSG